MSTRRRPPGTAARRHVSTGRHRSTTPAADANTPLRLPLGNQTLDRLNAATKQTQDERAVWESVIRGTDFDE